MKGNKVFDFTHSLTCSVRWGGARRSEEEKEYVVNGYALYIHIITSSNSNLYVKLNRFILFFDFSIGFNLIVSNCFFFSCCWCCIEKCLHWERESVHKNGMIILEYSRIFLVYFQKAPKKESNNNNNILIDNNDGFFLCYIFIHTVYNMHVYSACKCVHCSFNMGYISSFTPEMRCDTIQRQKWKWNVKINIRGNKIY